MSCLSFVRLRCVVAVLGLSLVILGLDPSRVLAGDLVVAPSKVQLHVNRGATTTFIVRVSNTATSTVTLNVRPWNFARDAEGNVHEIGIKDAARFRGCATWVRSPQPASRVVEPDSEAELKFVVDVPANAECGSRYCYLEFRSSPTPLSADQKSEYGVRAPIVYSMNAMLLVQVGPQEDEGIPAYRQKVSLRAFEVPRVNFGSRIDMRAAIRNEGNIHSNLVEGSGVQIWQGDRLKDRIVFQEYTLLPESTIAIPAVWTSRAIFGRYRARFVGALDDGRQRMTAERTFWVVNPWLAGAVVAAILLLLVFFVVFLRRFRIQLTPRNTVVSARSGMQEARGAEA